MKNSMTFAIIIGGIASLLGKQATAQTDSIPTFKLKPLSEAPKIFDSYPMPNLYGQRQNIKKDSSVKMPTKKLSGQHLAPMPGTELLNAPHDDITKLRVDSAAVRKLLVPKSK